MSLPDALQQLADLHARGSLSADEFHRAKQRVLEAGSPAPTATARTILNGLRRSADDRWLGGVCGGIAASTGLAAWVWRLLFVLLVSCAGTGLVVYLLAWLLLPVAAPVAQPPGLPPAAPRPAG